MPRIHRTEGPLVRSTRSKLAEELAEELRADRPSGQPVFQEQVYQSGLIRVCVLWDRWDRVRSEDRSNAILGAYQIVEGREYAEKVRLTTGLTYPEAANSGMLSYQILLALRPDDPVTFEDCRQAMIVEGASLLIDPDRPPLLFASREEAEASRARLVQLLPGSGSVWLLNHMIGSSLDLSWDDEA